ncbi:MAG: MBL fold metallo-hydrolase [Chloroflexota bacterium]|nr:MAG: MBL fold metallo-hydrolase [Chloroflexota bacterium]
MRKERVTEDIYIFQSEMYAQVTAGAIITDEGTVVIDTLPFPRETREMIEFLRGESRDKRGIRYVINTHYHADHVYGNYLFTEADIISSEKCREILRKSGEKNLNEAKQSTPELADVVLRLPNLTFPDKMTFQLGDRILKLVPLPGHTMDGIGIYIEGEKILFAGDAVMALPHIYWGDREVLINTLNQIKEMNVENIVQGHGDVLLKGEIDESIDAQIAYLNCIYERVKAKVATRTSKEKLADITLESCGGTPILLDGVVRKLHKDNVQRIYQTLTAKPRTDEKKVKSKA